MWRDVHYGVSRGVVFFFLTSIEHMFAETSSKISEGGNVTGIVYNKPSSDGIDSDSSVFFLFVVTVDNSTLGSGDVCC